MRLKYLVGGQISAAVLFSVPVLALLALSPWSSASQLGDETTLNSSDLAVVQSGLPRMTADVLAIEDLSDWKYTGGKKGNKPKKKSSKSEKSEKSKKSPKSKKSKKSEKNN